MPKAILFDADGVVIKARTQYFSVRFAEQYGISAEKEMMPFFRNDMREAFVDKVDIKDSLAKYLPKWNKVRVPFPAGRFQIGEDKNGNQK